MFKKNQFDKLATIRAKNCLTIYIPTHRSGFNNARIDHLSLKNALSEARMQLEERKVSPEEIQQILNPAFELLSQDFFWTQLSDGLALFLSTDHFEYYELPISFNQRVFIGNTYYLRPILPILTGNGRFFLLALSQNEVRFFEGTRNSITPVMIEDLVPINMEEALVYQDMEAAIQIHGAAGGHSNAIIHGQGAGKDQKKINLQKYFKQIDNGLMEILHDETAPLVIASVHYLQPIYRAISSYPYLLTEGINGNPEQYTPYQVHERAWQLVEPVFQWNQKTATKSFRFRFAKGQGGISTPEIVLAACEGRVETLFVNKDKDYIWGNYASEKAEVYLQKKSNISTTCLLNLAAVQTVQQGGTVYNVSLDEMPSPFSAMNAIYRY